MSVAEFEIRDVLVYGQGKPQTIGISDNQIAYVGQTQGAIGTLDGRGKLIALPAIIDGHTHFRTFGEGHKEDWTHGSKAAIWGGVGTVLDMGNHPAPHAVTTCEAFARKLAAIGQPGINFRLWFMATTGGISEFKKLRQDPYLYSYCAGIKLCMETTTGGLIVENVADQLEWCKVAADTDTFIAAHVGVESMIRSNRAKLQQPPTTASHCIIRDTDVELEGGRQFLRLLEASGARGEIKHVSTPELVEAAIKVRQRGVHVSLEICPHHWVFSQEQLAREDGAFFKMNPPLRTVDQVAAMQRYLADGTIDTVGTDHAPHTRAEKLRTRYDEVPSGVPGVQEMLPLLFTLVHEGKLTLEHMIDLTARTPAQLYRLYRKGRIEPGFDADIVLIDPNVESAFTEEEIQSKCGWSPYTGKRVYGKPQDVILAGDSVLYAKS